MADYAVTTTSPQRIDIILQNLDRAVFPTFHDVAMPLFKYLEKVKRNTEAGVDYTGNAFVPYNTTRPYYFYGDGVRAAKAVKTMGRRGLAKFKVNQLLSSIKKNGKYGTHTAKGRKFKSYADFKQRQGTSVVNLRHLSAVPGMIDHMVVVNGGNDDGLVTGNFYSSPQQVPNRPSLAGLVSNEQHIRAQAGVFNGPLDVNAFPGDGTLAAAHNLGLGGMPKRTFIALTSADVRQIKDDILQAVSKRIREL